MVETQLIGAGLGVALLGGGLVFLWAGLRVRRFGNALATAGSLDSGTDAGALTVAEGVIEGPQQGESLESGWSGTPCVAYATLRIEQKAHEQDEHWTKGSKEHDTDQEAIPFVLDTDRGPVEVDAADAHLEMDDFEQVDVADVQDNRGLLIGLWWFVRKLWTRADDRVRKEYLEGLYRPGDRVHVIGQFSHDGPSAHSIEPPSGGPLVVSSRPQEAVADRFKAKAKGRFFWGVAFLAGATWIFLKLAGVI